MRFALPSTAMLLAASLAASPAFGGPMDGAVQQMAAGDGRGFASAVPDAPDASPEAGPLPALDAAHRRLSDTPSPTSAPTTLAPTQPAWTIDFVNITSNFTLDSEDEVVMSYLIGKNRTYETYLYQADCLTNITDDDLDINKTVAKTNVNGTHDEIAISYSIDKAGIADSPVWNSTSSTIEICQVVKLTAETGIGKLDITTDTNVVSIKFDLAVNYTVTNDLGAGTVEDAAGAANVSSYVQACKCGGMANFTCDSGALVPNTELYVCISSVSPDVQVKQLVSMVATQDEAEMDIVEDGDVSIPGIAGMEYTPDESGVSVSTFVPTNIFNYSAGESISITGSIDMKLVGSTRKLLAGVDDGAFGADGSGKMSYEVNVDLQDEVIVLEEGEWTDSAGAFLGGASAWLGMAFVLTGLW